MQGVILGAFYYGYCITQIPGGRMSEMYSAKWVYGIGTFITALLTLLTPIAAKWHVGVLIFIRALEGLAQVSQAYKITCFRFLKKKWHKSKINVLWNFL